MYTEEGDSGGLAVLENEDEQNEQDKQPHDDRGPVAARASVGERGGRRGVGLHLRFDRRRRRVA